MVTIVLLPGMDGSGSLFADFVAALGTDVQTIIVDYPSRTALDYSALEALARGRLPLGRPFVLLGESFSGPIAIALAASRPAGLIGLVLCCSFASNPHPSLRLFAPLLRWLPVNRRIVDWAAPLLLGRFANARLKMSLQAALADVSVDVLRARLREVLEVDYLSRLAQIEVPLLYLRARDDRLVFASVSRCIAQALPDADIVSLTAPHLLSQAVPLDAARVVMRYVERWVRRAGLA